MAFPGWLSLGGIEIANSARTMAYARDLVPDFEFTDCIDCPDLAKAAGDGEYTSPLIDQPDWFDANNPDTWRFAGFYPLTVTGLTDSTRTAEVVESLGEGGTVGRPRHGTREVRVTGLLIGADECALDVGMSWLKSALGGDGCRNHGGGCAGDDLCFFTCCPEITEGTVDPDSAPVAHPVPLDAGWTEDSGTWVAGRWRPSMWPAQLVGPTLDPPCDEVRFEWVIEPADGVIVRAAATGEGGQPYGDTGDLRLRRTNVVPNPTFRDSPGLWTPGPGVSLTADQANEIGRAALSEDVPVGAPVVTADGTYAAAGTTWSGRVTVSTPAGSAAVCVRAGISVAGTVTYGPAVLLPAGGTADMTVDGVDVPAASVVEFGVYACDPAPSGSTVLLTRALLERGEVAGAYFDGDTEPGAGYSVRWAGSRNRSASVMDMVMPIVVVAPSGSGPVAPTLEAVDGAEINVVSVTAYYREPTDAAECAASYTRTLRRVTAISGPRITEYFDNGCGGAIVAVEFVLAAGVPWVYQTLPATFRLVDGTIPPRDVEWEDGCPADDALSPLNDPDCPLPPAPPRAPIPADCLEPVTSYRRHAIGIPGDLLAPWQEAVPVVSMRVTTGRAVRQARVRFYPNPLDRGNLIDLDPCSHCGEFVISYIPGSSEIVLDGMLERAVVTLPGDRQRDATHLLYATDGGPMQWPTLTCGTPYIMTVDTMPETTDVLATSLQLVVKG